MGVGYLPFSYAIRLSNANGHKQRTYRLASKSEVGEETRSRLCSLIHDGASVIRIHGDDHRNSEYGLYVCFHFEREVLHLLHFYWSL